MTTKPSTKPWYLSKAVWSGIIAVLIATYTAFVPAMQASFNITLPVIPEWVFAVLAAFGIYARAAATTTLTK